MSQEIIDIIEGLASQLNSKESYYKHNLWLYNSNTDARYWILTSPTQQSLGLHILGTYKIDKHSIQFNDLDIDLLVSQLQTEIDHITNNYIWTLY